MLQIYITLQITDMAVWGAELWDYTLTVLR